MKKLIGILTLLLLLAACGQAKPPKPSEEEQPFVKTEIHAEEELPAEGWIEWDFTLPDGSPIPEYTFPAYDKPWCMWWAEDGFNLTLDGGDGAGEQSYSCLIETGDQGIDGLTVEQSWETLRVNFDFDHDGNPETVQVSDFYGDRNGWYELQIQSDGLLWCCSAGKTHPAWVSYFACRVDGEDYLLRYLPTMYQGFATYEYELFSLREPGEEVVVREGSVSFDINFGGPMHEEFNPEEIAAFLKEVHDLLEGSELLLTTESGEFRSGGPGVEFKDDLAHWTDDPLYDGSKSLEDNIRAIGAYWEKQRTA